MTFEEELGGYLLGLMIGVPAGCLVVWLWLWLSEWTRRPRK